MAGITCSDADPDKSQKSDCLFWRFWYYTEKYNTRKYKALFWHGSGIMANPESENVPHYVQLLSFHVWDHYQHAKQIDEGHVAEALSLILRGQEPAYLTIWEGLTLHQRKTAKAAATLKGQLLTSKETIRNFRLESASNAAKSLSALCTKGILRKEQEGYVFEDVLFCRWVEKKTEQAS